MLLDRLALSLALATVVLAPPRLASPEEVRRGDLSGRRLKLTWYDGYRLLPHGFELMTAEVHSLFNPLGVRIDWKQGQAGPIPGPHGGSADPAEILVILSPSEPLGLGLSRDVMGAVLGQEVPRRAIYLFFPAVARTLGFRSNGETVRQPKWVRDLGRSLGRVLAHELVHAIAPEQPHAVDGLMSCSLKRNYLLAPRAELDPESASVFLAQLDRALPGSTGERAIAPGLSWAPPGRWAAPLSPLVQR